MLSRGSKRLVIGGIYIVVIGGLIGLWTYQKVKPTCTDGKQNGQEEGVDCGVVACGVACAVPVQALQIQTSQLVKTPAGDYDFAGQIYNPNPDYGAAQATYDLALVDANGVELSRIHGNSFYVLPGQTKYLVLTSLRNIPTGASGRIVVTSINWQKVAPGDTATVSLVSTNERYMASSAQTTFETNIMNNSDYDFDTVSIGVIVFDASNTVLATSVTNIQTVLSHSSRYVKVTWPFPLPANAHVYTEIGTNVFENANFIKQHGTQEKFQQYF